MTLVNFRSERELNTPWINDDGFKKLNINQQCTYNLKLNQEKFFSLPDLAPTSEKETNLTKDLQQNIESTHFDINKLVKILNRIQATKTKEILNVSSRSVEDQNRPVSDEENANAISVVDSNTQTPNELQIEMDIEGEILQQDEHDEQDEKDEIKIIDRVEEALSGKIHCKTIKSHFSAFGEIDHFLHAPIFGDSVQNTFEFIDSFNKLTPQLDTKLLSTITYYPDQPYCHLVSSEINELICLTTKVGVKDRETLEKKHYQSILNPVHELPKTDPLKRINSQEDFLTIRVPVVIGEYQIEICLEEEVLFAEEIIVIGQITKKIFLTNCTFIPSQFSKPLGNGTCKALKGIVTLEGYIMQNFEYTAAPDSNDYGKEGRETLVLNQKITLNLLLQLLQEQTIQSNCCIQ